MVASCCIVLVRRNCSLAAGLLAACLLANGCGGGPPVSAPVDPDKARETLRAALEGWKSGQSPEALRQGDPSIVVQDLDWSGGLKLVEYKALDDGRPVDANLIARVELTLRNDAGAETHKTVTYVVGTAPVLTVFRDMFQ